MNRRTFLKHAALLGLFGIRAKSVSATINFKVRAFSRGPRHHFFGYYGICPWNQSQTHLLSLETRFQDRMPTPSDVAMIGLVNCNTGQFEPVTETRAWNFQQGAMLHWHPQNPDTEIIFNDRVEYAVVSKILNLPTGRSHILARPINALSHSGQFALSVSYGRLTRLRKVVGYAGMIDPNAEVPYPNNDGVFLTDLTTGATRLVVSISQVNAVLLNRGLDLKGTHLWFNHVAFNPSDSRFLFLARAWRPPHLPHLRDLATGMFTANIDGSDLREALPFEYGVSHFDWRNDHEIIAAFQDVHDRKRFKHFLFTDGSGNYESPGNGALDFDGHCTFAPNQNVFATDRKIGRENEFRQYLYIFDLATQTLRECVNFDMRGKQNIHSDFRCDFHPRWNRTGDAICFDSIDQGDGTRLLHGVFLDP